MSNTSFQARGSDGRDYTISIIETTQYVGNQKVGIRIEYTLPDGRSLPQVDGKDNEWYLGNSNVILTKID